MENKSTFIKDNLEPIFEKFKNMIKVETVVGEAIQIGDATLVPFVDVTLGFGSGAGKADCGGGGGGAKMEPTAILVIKGERVELFNIKGSAKYSGFDRLIGMVPEVISKLKKDKYIYINENDGTTAK